MSLTTVVELDPLPHHLPLFQVRQLPPLRCCRFSDVALVLMVVFPAQKSALYPVSTALVVPIGQMG